MLGSENTSRSIPAGFVGADGELGVLAGFGAPGDCLGNSPMDGDTADGANPGVVAKMAGSEPDDGDRVGVTPALAAGKTWALGSLMTSTMACAKALRSQPAKAGAVDGMPGGVNAGAGGAGAGPSAPPRASLVFAVGIDFDTFQCAESIRSEGGRRAVE